MRQEPPNDVRRLLSSHTGSRLEDAPATRSLPVVESCHRNFTARGPAAADPDCILDQTTLSALVLAADRQTGGDGTRIDLAKLLASAAA